MFLRNTVPNGSNGEIERSMEKTVTQAFYEARAGYEAVPSIEGIADDAMLRAKLFSNPCWFSYRMNYLALHFNTPIYGYIQKTMGLLRPEFVVIWSIYLTGPSTLTDVVRTSGFPKNTLSRAVLKLSQMGLILREVDQEDQRRIGLALTEAGLRAARTAEEVMIRHERQMLEVLTPAERLNLSEILTKLVSASGRWPQQIEPVLDQDEPVQSRIDQIQQGK